jgi:sugar O-acyltransferase (sialic acid O-acetyltransferase NeuD family)
MGGKQKLIILGAGGHGRVLFDALRGSESVAGWVDRNPELAGKTILGVPVLGDDRWLENQDPQSLLLVNGVGTTTADARRSSVFEKWKKAGFRFASVVHPSAVVSGGAQVGEGAQVMAGAVVQIGAVLDDDVIVNTGAVIDHDCRIGKHTHIAPGVVLSGSVQVGKNCHIGTGAKVIQGIQIAEGALVAAGAVVVSDVALGQKVFGVPARSRE